MGDDRGRRMQHVVGNGGVELEGDPFGFQALFRGGQGSVIDAAAQSIAHRQIDQDVFGLGPVGRLRGQLGCDGESPTEPNISADFTFSGEGPVVEFSMPRRGR